MGGGNYQQGMQRYAGGQRPSAMPDRTVARPPERVPSELQSGELGVVRGPGGRPSTEFTITTEDQRLNQGMPTNIPMLVEGQNRVDALLSGNRADEEQYLQALTRALKRDTPAPAYATIADAVWAAQNRKTSGAKKSTR